MQTDRERYFKFNNLWHYEVAGNDSNFMPFDPSIYATYREFRHDKPEQWMAGWELRYKGATEEEVSKQSSIYSDPNEVFVKGIWYGLVTRDIVYYEGSHFVTLKIHGIDGLYNPTFFTTLPSKESIHNPFKILLKNPSKEMPEYGTPEYRILFKETAGGCVVGAGNDESLEFFDYIGHLMVTRKPEELPDWLKERSKAKPKKKINRAEEYFHMVNKISQANREKDSE